MHYIIQSNIYKEHHYLQLKKALDELGFTYEEYAEVPFSDNLISNVTNSNIWVFGSVKLARLASAKNWYPGSFYGGNHDFEIYGPKYGQHMLNSDSIVVDIKDFTTFEGLRFIRPCKDNKAFLAGVRDDEEWQLIRETVMSNENYKDIRIQVCTPKTIYREIRLFVVGGEIVTGSQYTFGKKFFPDEYIGEDVLLFGKEMVQLYQPADSFVIDIAETPNGLKIVEINCINCSGFYKSDIKKLLLALENRYSV